MIRWAVVALALLALGATARRPHAFRFQPDAQTELRIDGPQGVAIFPRSTY
jgi:hypothetical protein